MVAGRRIGVCLLMSLDFDSICAYAILEIELIVVGYSRCCCACEGGSDTGCRRRGPNSHCVFSGPLPRQLGVLLLKRI